LQELLTGKVDKANKIPNTSGTGTEISIVSLSLHSPMTRKQLLTLKNPNNHATPPGFCISAMQVHVAQTGSSILMLNNLQAQFTNSCMAV
jgi:hypothetical protein